MLGYWQRRNDRMAMIMIGMAHHHEIPRRIFEEKHRLWAKCVYWGE